VPPLAAGTPPRAWHPAAPPDASGESAAVVRFAATPARSRMHRSAASARKPRARISPLRPSFEPAPRACAPIPDRTPRARGRKAAGAARPTRTSAPPAAASRQQEPVIVATAPRPRSRSEESRSVRFAASLPRANLHRARQSRWVTSACERRCDLARWLDAREDGKSPALIWLPGSPAATFEAHFLALDRGTWRHVRHQIRPWVLPLRSTPTTMPSMSSGCSFRSTRMGSKSLFSGSSQTTEPSWR
jgi:hypothetical protein